MSNNIQESRWLKMAGVLSEGTKPSEWDEEQGKWVQKKSTTAASEWDEEQGKWVPQKTTKPTEDLREEDCDEQVAEAHLRKMIRETLAVIDLSHGALPVDRPEAPEELLADLLSHTLGRLRAVHLWFHSAHNLAKGPGFVGDHTDLYGDIYEQLSSDYDTAAEKAISLTGDEGIACPQRVVAMAAEKLQEMPSPSGMGAEQIVAAALNIVTDLIDRITEMFEMLEAAGVLSLGLNDFLAALVNQYETYVYLLQQRAKE